MRLLNKNLSTSQVILFLEVYEEGHSTITSVFSCPVFFGAKTIRDYTSSSWIMCSNAMTTTNFFFCGTEQPE